MTVAANQLKGKFNQVNQDNPDMTTLTPGMANGSKHSALTQARGLGSKRFEWRDTAGM
jgi:hypothetical protein